MKTDKFYLTSTGEEVTYGDTIKEESHNGNIHSIYIVTLAEDTVPPLLNTGILSTKKLDDSLTISDIIDRIATRMGWKTNKVRNYLYGISNIMPMAAFNVLAREIATMLDEKYPNHINECEKVYVISSLDGVIREVPRAHIKNYRNFAAFRTIDDARIACKVLRGPLKSMFSGK